MAGPWHTYTTELYEQLITSEPGDTHFRELKDKRINTILELTPRQLEAEPG